MSKCKKWLLAFGLVSLLGLTAVAALTIYVDPFFQYHKPLSWFPYLVDHQVNMNPGLAKNMDYDSILLGSSMTVSFNTDWFEEEMGLKTQKLSYNGAFPKDQETIMNIVFEAKGDQITDVFLGIDELNYSADVNQTKFPLPEYLYDKNYLNDVQYIWNKDVVFEHIPYMFAMTYLDDYDEGTSYNWAQYKTFSKEDTLQHYSRPESVQPMLSEEEYKENVDANITLIENVVKAHPEVTFRFICPPYSMLWWDAAYRNGETEQNLYASTQAAERLLVYENVEMYYFQNKEELITNLDNYMDTVHFSDEINHAIVEWMEAGEYQLTLDNYQGEIEKMRDLSEKIQEEYVVEYFSEETTQD